MDTCTNTHVPGITHTFERMSLLPSSTLEYSKIVCNTILCSYFAVGKRYTDPWSISHSIVHVSFVRPRCFYLFCTDSTMFDDCSCVQLSLWQCRWVSRGSVSVCFYAVLWNIHERLNDDQDDDKPRQQERTDFRQESWQERWVLLHVVVLMRVDTQSRLYDGMAHNARRVLYSSQMKLLVVVVR